MVTGTHCIVACDSGDIRAAAGLRSRIRGLEELESPPRDAQRLLDLVSQEDLEIDDLACALEASPPVAARVLGVAGSAYFAREVPVRSVKDAVVGVLGLDLVRSLVMGMVIANVLRPPRDSRFEPVRYWRSALFTAAFARTLSIHLTRTRTKLLHRWSETSGEDPLHPDSAYLCGLLHNIGLLAMVAVDPQAMEYVFDLAAQSPHVPLRVVERDSLGTDHCEIGAILAARWHLPPEIGVVSARMHDPAYAGPYWCLCAAAGLGSREVRIAAGMASEPGDHHLRSFALEAGEYDDLCAEFRAQVSDLDALSQRFAGGG